MITTFILAVLGVLLLFVLWQMMRKEPSGATAAIPASKAPIATGALPSGGDLWTAKIGDVVSLHGAAEDFSDLDFTVDQRGAYESKDRRWVGLGGDFRGRRVYVEISRVGGTQVMGILEPRRLTLPELGLTEDLLADMDSRQDPSRFIQFDEKKWYYDSSRELAYYEAEGTEARGVYRWLFAEQNGSRLLCIEKWEGEPFDVRLARKLDPQDITVYRAG